ncbi:MAG: TssN family type VI secretion system protein [Chitinophagaceae bacterium]
MEVVAPNIRTIRAYLKYVPLMVLLLGLSGFLQLASFSEADLAYYLTAALAGMLGIIHVLLLYGFFGLDSPVYIKQCCILTATILLISAALSGTGYLIMGLDIHFLGYLSAFIIPFLLSLGYSYYLQIPASTHKYWYHPLQPHHVPPPLDQADTELVKFVLSKSSISAIETSFTLDAPVDLPVSQIFINLINEHNRSKADQPIEYLDQYHEPVGWLFFVRQGMLFKKQFIDPDLTLRGNGIRPGKIIYATRKLSALQSTN